MHIKWKIRGLYIIVIAILILQLINFKRQPATGDRWSLADTYNLVNSVLPIVTVGLLFLTFKSQNEQLELQKTATANAQADAANARLQLALKQVEDRFFSFLEIHRGNVKDMSYRNEEGKRVFIAIVNKFTEMFGTLNDLLPLFVEDNELSQDLTISEKIEIAYLLIFYGCTGENSTRMIAHALSPYDKYVVDKRDTFAGLIVTQLEYRGMLADGFQTNLGNYFRHLFQTVTYIHDHERLAKDDKRFYIKRLRGQFSNHEIAVLFLNSFSIGKRWTNYQSRMNPVATDLITKYRLIQNLPSGFFKEFDFRCFFSEIRYEGQTKPFKDYPEFKLCC